MKEIDQHGERFYEAELYHLHGELWLQPSQAEQTLGRAAQQAETPFLRALDVARQQEAKAFELRAAVSLSRLWQSQGKQADAAALLTGIYTWYSEGFDTVDLQEAGRLLQELHA